MDSSNGAHHPDRGLFRTADHVIAVMSAGVLAVLDLERGLIHSCTPYGVRAWAALTEGKGLRHGPGVGLPAEPALAEDQVALAQFADHLLEHRLVEPVPGGGKPNGEELDAKEV